MHSEVHYAFLVTACYSLILVRYGRLYKVPVNDQPHRCEGRCYNHPLHLTTHELWNGFCVNYDIVEFY